MNKRNDAQRKVLRAVLTVLARNQTHGRHATGFKTLVARLQSRAQQIDHHEQTTTEDLTLLTESKNLLRQQLFAVTLAISGALIEYAIAANHAELERLAAVHRVHLRKGRENLALAEAERIRALVAPYAADMAVQNPDFALLAPFDDLIEAYRAAIVEVRQAAISRSAAVRAIASHTTGSRRDLATLDRIMAQFEITAPAFYADYRQARVNTDSGPRKAKRATSRSTATSPDPVEPAIPAGALANAA